MGLAMPRPGREVLPTEGVPTLFKGAQVERQEAPRRSLFEVRGRLATRPLPRHPLRHSRVQKPVLTGAQEDEGPCKEFERGLTGLEH